MTQPGEFQAFSDMPQANAADLRAHIAAGQERGEYDKYLATLGNTLADRLDNGEGFIPLVYMAEIELVVNDCAEGVDGRTGQPMPQELRGHPQMLYGIWRKFMQRWGQEAFGEDFGQSMREFYAAHDLD